MLRALKRLGRARKTLSHDHAPGRRCSLKQKLPSFGAHLQFALLVAHRPIFVRQRPVAEHPQIARVLAEVLHSGRGDRGRVTPQLLEEPADVGLHCSRVRQGLVLVDALQPNIRPAGGMGDGCEDGAFLFGMLQRKET
jgi:hypothetical protein